MRRQNVHIEVDVQRPLQQCSGTTTHHHRRNLLFYPNIKPNDFCIELYLKLNTKERAIPSHEEHYTFYSLSTEISLAGLSLTLQTYRRHRNENCVFFSRSSYTCMSSHHNILINIQCIFQVQYTLYQQLYEIHFFRHVWVDNSCRFLPKRLQCA